MSEETTSLEVQLQLEDLIRLLEAINLASSRGAFRPQEFSTIGGVYDRVFGFLEASGAIQRPQQQEEQPEGSKND